MLTDNTATPKTPKEISADSLQNPSDPDATYSGHKGQGFQAQIMETYSEDKKETFLNLITYIEVEPSHNSDAYALIPAIESVKEQKMMPEVVLADSLYVSDDNTQKTDEMAVEIVSPVMGGAILKATAVNVFRAAVVRTARGMADRGKLHTYFSPSWILKIVKELFCFFKPYFCYE